MADPASEIDPGYVFAEGYRTALAHAGLPSNPRPMLRTETDEAGSHTSMSTAIILDGDSTAIGIYHRLSGASDRPWRPIG